VKSIGEFVAKLILDVRDFRARLRDAAQDAEQETARVAKASKGLSDAAQEAMSGQMDMASAARAALSVLGPAAAAGAVAVGAVAVAFVQGREEAREYERAIASTGNAAGVTASTLADMARGIDASVGTQALAAQTLAQMTATGKVAGENMQFLAEAAIEAERSTASSIDKVVGNYAKLADAPVKASLQLNDSMNYLTAATFAQIKAAEDLGDKERAAALAQETYAAAEKKRAAEVEKNLSSLARAWRNVKEWAREAWDEMLNLGREENTGRKLEAAKRQLEAHMARGPLNDLTRESWEKGAERLRKEIAQLSEKAGMDQRSADAKAQQVKAENAYIDLLMEGDKHLDGQEKMYRAVAAATQKYQDALKSETLTKAQRNDLERTYLAIVSDITKAKETKASTGRSGKSELERQLEAEAAAMAKALGLNTDYVAQLKLLESARQRGAMSEAQYVEAVEHLISVQPVVRKWTDEQKKADDAAAKAAKEHAKEVEKLLQQRVKAADQAEDALRRASEEEEAHKLAADAGISLAEAVAQIAAARADDNYQKAVAKGADEQTLAALTREMEARRKIINVMGERSVREANEKAAKEAERTWEQVSQTVGNTLADYIMGGGRDAAQYLKRLFATLVLQPIVKYGAQTLMGMMGLGGTTAAGAGGGALSTLGSAGGILSGVGAMGGAFAGGLGWLTGATTLGGALGAGGSLIAAGGAGVLPGMGMIAGALAPIGLGLGALFSLYSSLDRSGTPHWGAAAEYDGTTLTGGDAVFRRSGTAGRYSGQAQAGVDAVARSVGDTLNTLSRIFGGAGGYDVMTAYSDDSSDDPGFGSLRVRRGGQNVLDWENGRTSKWAPKIFADGEEGWKMYLSAVAKDVRDVFLSPDMGAPSWARSMLQSLDDSVTMDQLAAVVQQIGEIQTLFVNLGDTLVGFADMTDLAFEALLRASGGAQALAANADAFYQNFYSDTERKDIAKRQLGEKLKELGVDIDLDDPQAREKYRALVEQKLAQANTEEASKAALKEQLSDSVLSNMFAGGGIEGLVGLDIAGLPPGLLGNDGVATQEQIDKLNAGIAALDTAGMSLDDLKGSVGDLLEPIVGTGKGAAETAAALLGLSGSFASVTMSAEEAEAAAKAAAEADQKSRRDESRAATDAALQALERAAAAERTAIQARVTAAQERVAQERAIVELTQGHVRELRGQVDTTAAMAVAQARRFIDDAVAAAGNSGYLPDQAELSRAIDTVRGGMGQDAYSSRLAWEEAQLKMALQLETLGDSAKEQLTTDEQTLAAAEEQLRYLDDMLTAARVEIDAIRGTTKAVESVTAAIDSLSAAILKEKEDGEGKGEGKGGGGEGGGKFAIGGSGPGESAGGSGGGHIETEEEEIRRYYKGIDISDAQSMRNARNTALFMGWTQEDIARAYDVDVEDLRKLFDDFGIPAFARGGTHAGGLRLVGEEGPELEVTGAARIYSAGQTRDMLSQLSGGGASAEMARAVERLALAVEGQGTRLGDIGQHTRDTADVLMRVTRGGQAMQNANASKTLELRV
jgi:hypothetical protein